MELQATKTEEVKLVMMTLESRKHNFRRALRWLDRWTLDAFNADPTLKH